MKMKSQEPKENDNTHHRLEMEEDTGPNNSLLNAPNESPEKIKIKKKMCLSR
jgi:hypothetical protein